MCCVCVSVCLSLSLSHMHTCSNAHILTFLSVGLRTCQSQPLIPLLPRSVCTVPTPHFRSAIGFMLDLNGSQPKSVTLRLGMLDPTERMVVAPSLPSPIPLPESRIHVGFPQAVSKGQSQDTLFLKAGGKTVFSQWFQKEGAPEHVCLCTPVPPTCRLCSAQGSRQKGP